MTFSAIRKTENLLIGFQEQAEILKMFAQEHIQEVPFNFRYTDSHYKGLAVCTLFNPSEATKGTHIQKEPDLLTCLHSMDMHSHTCISICTTICADVDSGRCTHSCT